MCPCRFAPEPISFLVDALLSALPQQAQQPHQAGSVAKQVQQAGGGKKQRKQDEAGLVQIALAAAGSRAPLVAPGLLCLHTPDDALAKLQPAPPQLLAALQEAGGHKAEQAASGNGGVQGEQGG